MTFERRRCGALALLCKAHVMAEHADEDGSAEVRERLGDAHTLRDVDIAAEPALGADDEDCLVIRVCSSARQNIVGTAPVGGSGPRRAFLLEPPQPRVQPVFGE